MICIEQKGGVVIEATLFLSLAVLLCFGFLRVQSSLDYHFSKDNSVFQTGMFGALRQLNTSQFPDAVLLQDYLTRTTKGGEVLGATSILQGADLESMSLEVLPATDATKFNDTIKIESRSKLYHLAPDSTSYLGVKAITPVLVRGEEFNNTENFLGSLESGGSKRRDCCGEVSTFSPGSCFTAAGYDCEDDDALIQ